MTTSTTTASPLVGAIDQGTTSSRFILFDTTGNIVASHQMEHDQIQSEPGWCEHDPNQIWDTVHECIAKTMEQVPDAVVSVIGITNQRETSLLWDKVTGQPVYNALVWHDMRTSDIVHELLQGHDINRFRATTGLPLATYFSAVKIMWLLRHIPGLRAKADAGDVLFGTIDTWLLWKLSGGAVHATDVSNASRTNLMDLHTLQWSDGTVSRSCLYMVISFMMLGPMDWFIDW
ncbi:hypothetical protein B5M09_008113 [Aphanomyces astaci]|uniref:glycerol kinase n=1 Tax=Aphanomyces astaci TaxID=112090 RepID=A0A425DCG2_APHAT|nr:hypothetical protein B5M09_008113 [Aphanomyces astaci]